MYLENDTVLFGFKAERRKHARMPAHRLKLPSGSKMFLVGRRVLAALGPQVDDQLERILLSSQNTPPP
jgi:hypothetical protein